MFVTIPWRHFCCVGSIWFRCEYLLVLWGFSCVVGICLCCGYLLVLWVFACVVSFWLGCEYLQSILYLQWMYSRIDADVFSICTFPSHRVELSANVLTASLPSQWRHGHISRAARGLYVEFIIQLYMSGCECRFKTDMRKIWLCWLQSILTWLGNLFTQFDLSKTRWMKAVACVLCSLRNL